MNPAELTQADIATGLLSFIRDSFLAGDPEGELTEHTPLLEYGILNSLNTAELIAYIRDEVGILIPLDDVTADTFRTVASLGTFLGSLRTQA